jgi:hypothetical protein
VLWRQTLWRSWRRSWWWRRDVQSRESGLPVVQDVGALIRRQAASQDGTAGLIYWEHVAAQTPEQYKASLVGFSPERMLEEVVVHTSGSAHVAVRKYALLRTAFSFGVPGLLISAAWVLTL